MTPSSHRTLAALAIAAIACLVAMVALTLATGISQETFEIVRPPDVYGADLRAHAGVVRAMFGLDSAFIILYASLFVVFGRRIATAETRALVRLAIGAMLATAVLDMIEDHHVLAMLYGAETGTDPSPAELALQHTASQVKFHLSYLGAFWLGLAMPRASAAGKVLALLLTVGTLVQSVSLYAMPVAQLPAGNLGRWIGYLVAFALTIAVSRRAGDGAAATGARA